MWRIWGFKTKFLPVEQFAGMGDTEHKHSGVSHVLLMRANPALQSTKLHSSTNPYTVIQYVLQLTDEETEFLSPLHFYCLIPGLYHSALPDSN